MSSKKTWNGYSFLLVLSVSTLWGCTPKMQYSLKGFFDQTSMQTATPTPTPATQLVFTTAAPGAATAGSNFTSFAVSAEDGSGNVDTAWATNITLTAFTDAGCTTTPGGGSLSGATAVPSSGVGTFTSAQYTAIETIYLKATSGALTTACSSAIVVSVGAATKLIFTVSPPASATAGTNFTSFAVSAEDAGGNVTSGWATNITLTAFTDSGCTTTPASGTITGASVVPASGVGTFATTQDTAAETIYLKASSGGLTAACSSATLVSAATATKLIFTTSAPGSATAGSNFTSFAVSAEDANGNVDTTWPTNITLSAFSDSGCTTTPALGTFTGTSAVPSSGIGTFGSAQYTKAETIYIKASSGAITVACSSAVVVGAGAPAKLVITGPSSMRRIDTCSSAFTVTSEDANGNTSNVTGATSLTLTGNGSGTFYLDGGCSNQVDNTTNPAIITNGTSAQTFYFKDSTIENLTLNAAFSSWTDGTLAFNVNAAIMFIQKTPFNENETSDTGTITFPTLPAVGNTIVVYAYSWLGGLLIPSLTGGISDNQGNTYTEAVSITGAASAAHTAVIYSAPVTVSSGTFTITVALTSGNWPGAGFGDVDYIAVEYAGIDTVSPVDKTSTHTIAGGTSMNTGTTAMTTVSDELVAAVMVNDGSDLKVLTETGGFTTRASDNDGVKQIGAATDKIVSSTGTYQDSWTLSSDGGDWSAAIATFKAAP